MVIYVEGKNYADNFKYLERRNFDADATIKNRPYSCWVLAESSLNTSSALVRAYTLYIFPQTYVFCQRSLFELLRLVSRRTSDVAYAGIVKEFFPLFFLKNEYATILFGIFIGFTIA